MVAKAKTTKTKGTILITGASRGLGFEFARQYVADGWHVIATCRNPEKAAQLKTLLRGHDNLTVFQMDVQDTGSIARLKKSLRNVPIDVLLNNAGVVGKDYYKNGKELTLDKVNYVELARVIDVNMTGPLRVAEALLPNVKKSKHKKIVSISSVSGSIKNGWSDAVAYSVSKAGLNCIMRAFAGDLKPHKVITINLCPGPTATDMNRRPGTFKATDSVARMRKIIDKAGLKDTGRFVDRNGKDIPW